MNFTVKQVAKKLKVSEGHIYDLVKKEKIRKVPNLGRTIRIPDCELKDMNVESRDYFLYDSEKVEINDTSLGKIRKIKRRNYYVLVDIAKAIGIKDTSTIAKAVSKTFLLKLNTEKTNYYGMFSNQFGILLIHAGGIYEYSLKSKYRDKLKILVEELNITDLGEKKNNLDLENKTTSKNITQEIQIFRNPEFGQVRTIIRNNEPWFVGKDVAEILGYVDTDQAIRNHIDEEDKLTRKIDGVDQSRNVKVINESGLYSLILSSKLPEAKKFKHWVTSEVLPQIRQTGGYVQVEREEEFTNNYFQNLSNETKKMILKDLKSKKLELTKEIEEIVKKRDDLNKIIVQIEAK